MKRARCTPTPEQYALLEDLANRRASEPGIARRAQVILLSAQGVSGIDIASRLQLSGGQVSRIRARFLSEGVAGLRERVRRGRSDHAVPAAVVHTVLELARLPPPPGHRRWSTRLLATRVGLTSTTVSKILRIHARGMLARRSDVRSISARE